ncbi:MAG: ribbon-helix-helix protein, CopG family [Thermoplasmata archaeon]|nr:MAG: ribbon-helix-helix protein, CopG family [Thermoplasmata archaeon]
MNPKRDKITIRLPDDLMEAIDLLVKTHEFTNRSHVIRSAVEALVRERAFISSHETEEIPVRLPKRYVETLDFLTGIEYFPSRASAIREAVKVLLFDQIDLWKLKSRAEMMQKLEWEMAKEKDSKESIDKILKK